MEAIERLKAMVESLIEERNMLREDRDRLIEEAKDLMGERDEARKCAEEIRDLCVGVFPFPWEQGGKA